MQIAIIYSSARPQQVKAISKIDNFKTIPEFEKWMKGLDEKDETGL